MITWLATLSLLSLLSVVGTACVDRALHRSSSSSTTTDVVATNVCFHMSCDDYGDRQTGKETKALFSRASERDHRSTTFDEVIVGNVRGTVLYKARRCRVGGVWMDGGGGWVQVVCLAGLL